MRTRPSDRRVTAFGSGLRARGPAALNQMGSAALQSAQVKILALTLALAVTAALAGCGVRGPLDPPPQAAAEGTAKSAQAGAAGENSAAKPKPHEGFVLDPLLR